MGDASTVEQWSIDRLMPYVRNARRHSDAQIDALASSIRAYGFTVPVLVAEDGTIIAGHGRTAGAKRLGMEKIPVIVARGWSQAQISAYALADNRLAEKSSWDADLLAVELADLSAMGVELDGIGFDAADLEAMRIESDFAEAPATVQENVEQLQEIQRQRRAGNQQVADKHDTERYLVVIFPTRTHRERAMEALGLPADERYVASDTVEVRLRIGSRERPLRTTRAIKAASTKHSGDTG